MKEEIEGIAENQIRTANNQNPHIAVTPETKKKLDELTTFRGQTYDEIINEIIKAANPDFIKTHRAAFKKLDEGEN